MGLLQGKKILLGVSGGIAVYKSCELLRLLKKEGAEVLVLMTENAKKFVSPLTFESLSMSKCYYDIFSLTEEGKILHVSLGKEKDLIIIAPATANIIGKIASGIADNIVSLSVLDSTSPVLLAPSMHNDMWENFIVQENIRKLIHSKRFFLCGPQKGELCSGDIGWGRMADPEEILEEGIKILTPKDLEGKKIVITAGPTREYIDPVRFISNPSSGKMGYALAICAYRRGADVSLISGPTSLKAPSGVNFTRVETTEDMLNKVALEIENADVLIMSAAPCDERPVEKKSRKIKKENFKNALPIEGTPDILKTLQSQLKGKVVVGFAAETEDLIMNAKKKMKEKKLSMIFANPISAEKSPFNSNNIEGFLLSKDGTVIEIKSTSKFDVANIILDKVYGILKK